MSENQEFKRLKDIFSKEEMQGIFENVKTRLREETNITSNSEVVQAMYSIYCLEEIESAIDRKMGLPKYYLRRR